MNFTNPEWLFKNVSATLLPKYTSLPVLWLGFAAAPKISGKPTLYGHLLLLP